MAKKRMTHVFASYIIFFLNVNKMTTFGGIFCRVDAIWAKTYNLQPISTNVNDMMKKSGVLRTTKFLSSLDIIYEFTKNQILTYSSLSIIDQAYARLQNVDNNPPITHDNVVLTSTYGRG